MHHRMSPTPTEPENSKKKKGQMEPKEKKKKRLWQGLGRVRAANSPLFSENRQCSYNSGPPVMSRSRASHPCGQNIRHMNRTGMSAWVDLVLYIAALLLGVNVPHNVVGEANHLVAGPPSHLGEPLRLGLVLESVARKVDSCPRASSAFAGPPSTAESIRT